MRDDFSGEDKTVTNPQRGAASIFIVIFFALLTSVITVSFVKITNHDAQQALNNDLSQSAYDAAKAGVVDGTRAITYCEQEDPDTAACLAKLQNKCDDVASFAGKLNLEADEKKAVRVGTGSDAALNQSYTCAKVNLTPKTVSLTLDDQRMRIIELKSSSAVPVITLKWFDNQNSETEPLHLPSGSKKLPRSSSEWGGSSTPPLLRVQLVKPGSNLDDLAANSSSVFLYPTAGNPDNATDMAPSSLALVTEGSRTAPKTKQPVKAPCDATRYSNGQLACAALMVTGSIPANTSAYLIIMPLYNKTNLEIQALNGSGTPVGLDGYPEIDVTGRAGDVFRRVKSTVDLHGTSASHDLPGFDTTRALCKNFAVTHRSYLEDAATVEVCGDNSSESGPDDIES